MARIPRMVVKGEDTIYHVISRTVLPGFVLGDVEKDYFFKLIKWMSEVFFVEVYGFCIMGNHFHLLLKMERSENYTDDEVKKRLGLFFQSEGRVVINPAIK